MFLVGAHLWSRMYWKRMIHGQVKPVDGDPSSHALAGELAPGQPDFSFQGG